MNNKNSHETVVCPSCSSSEVKFIEKKQSWRCHNCDESFHLGENAEFTAQKIFLSYAHLVDGNDDDTALLVDAIQEKLIAAGHEAWIDKEQLNPGSDWRQGITEGILDSDRVLSFLSTRSIRDPGVCLDEIGIAMGVKNGAIATLLSDKRVKDASPASVTHIQYLDLSAWKDEKAKGEEIWDRWLSEQTQRILDIIARNAGFAGDIERLAKILQPLPVSSKIGSLLSRGFVGRQWAMQEIENWRLQQPTQKLFWLKAGPGMGKSAIAAHLAHFAKTQTVAVHFCDYKQPESRSAVRFVHNLAFMLAARLGDYRKLLEYQLKILDKPLVQFNADELMRRLILEPLHNKIDGGQIEDRLLVVVDALDEADLELPELLARYVNEMPAWLGFVVTSRPETSSLLAQFNPLELSINDERNKQDLNTYIDQWLGKESESTTNWLTRQALLEASEGNIMYLVYAKEAVQIGQLDLNHIDALPKGVVGLYRQWLVRQFGAKPLEQMEWREKCYPLLEFLCASPEPLPLTNAAKLLGWTGQDRVAATMPLGSLVEHRDSALQLCHRSFSDWLQDETQLNNPFWINTEIARQKLTRSLMDALPVSLTDEKPGYLHMALPQLLQKLSKDSRHIFWSEQWTDISGQLRDLEKYLSNHHTKAVNDRRCELQKFLFDGNLEVLGERHPATLISMNNLAYTYAEQGNFAAARQLQEKMLEVSKKVLGERHPNTLSSMGNLARTLARQGNLDAALDLQMQVSLLSKEVLGERHPSTMTSMTNLAQTLFEQGHLAAARDLQEQVLALRKDVSGERNTSTLTIMSDLAKTFAAQGELALARQLEEQVLGFSKEVLGEHHPDTLYRMSNLAQTIFEQGYLDAARQLQEQVLEMRRKVLGDRHPDTLDSMCNLAGSLFAKGELEATRQLQEQVLSMRLIVSGERDPSTLASMSNLASTFAAQENLTAALQLQEQVLAISKEVMGERHPATMISMGNLANMLATQGRLVAARQLQEQVLAMSKEVLGERHPDTLLSMGNLASTLAKQEDWPEARPLQEQVLALCKEVLGERHPETLTSMGNLAGTLAKQGRWVEARQLQEQVLTMSNEVLGERHPDTLTSMICLANTLNAQEEWTDARQLQEQVLALCKEVLGERHPDTLTCMTNLAITFYRQGYLTQARELQEQVLELHIEMIGHCHPTTLTSRSNLASTLFKLGILSDAKRFQKMVLESRKVVLGKRHVDTLKSMNYLAQTLHAEGILPKAIQLLKQVVTLRREVSGNHHPDTLTIMTNLIDILSENGDTAAARKLQKEVLALRKYVLDKPAIF